MNIDGVITTAGGVIKYSAAVQREAVALHVGDVCRQGRLKRIYNWIWEDGRFKRPPLLRISSESCASVDDAVRVIAHEIATSAPVGHRWQVCSASLRLHKTFPMDEVQGVLWKDEEARVWKFEAIKLGLLLPEGFELPGHMSLDAVKARFALAHERVLVESERRRWRRL